MREIIEIMGVKIDNVSLQEAGDITKNLIENSNKSCELIVAPNVEIIMMAQKDKEFFDILNTSKLATPDSKGVEIAANKQKRPLKERIPGQKYFRKVLEIGENEGWTFYLLGGKGDTVVRAIDNIKGIYPKINIVGYHEGYFENDSEENVIMEINRLSPNVLFVGMGAPIQEKWIYNHKEQLCVDIAAAQGGTLDYESGNIKRAPVFIQKIGLEWFWRLILQPKRIVRMMALPKFLFKVIFAKDITKSKF